jgi:hypothetical protein
LQPGCSDRDQQRPRHQAGARADHGASRLDARRLDGTRDAAWAAIEQAVIGKAVDLL